MYQVLDKGVLIGIKINHIPTGTIPQTEINQPLQLVTLKHSKGTILKAHVHIPKKRVTSHLQECIIVRKGKVELNIYGSDGSFIKRLILKEGELFLLIEGGLGIVFLSNSEIFEIKNGPFKEDKKII